MPKIIDVCIYNGEKDLFEIRYNILKDYVDEFIVVEFDKTFSGQPKPWRFIEYNFKNVYYHGLEEKDYLKYKELAENSPNTKGAEHWKREFMQKESIKDCLTHLKDDDIVFIGDTDEIVEPLFYTTSIYKIIKFKLRVYTYWLNNRSNEVFWGTIKARYGDIKGECLNHLRNNDERKNTIFEAGWHFTSLKDGLAKKLTDSYTEEDYAHPRVLNELKENIENNRDFLGRDFTYKVDESQWPDYLKENRSKYLHLLK